MWQSLYTPERMWWRMRHHLPRDYLVMHGTRLPASRPAAPYRRLRILDITDFYSDTVSGGVKTYLHAKARALPDLGFEHAMVVPGERDTEEAVGSSRLYRIRGTVMPASRAYRVMLSSSALRAILRRERPDVVEVGSPFVIPTLLERALGGVRVPLVGFYHADVVRTFAEPYVPSCLAAPLRVGARMAARLLVRRVYRRFDATVAASRSVADELRAFGIQNVHCIGLGVDLTRFRPREEEAVQELACRRIAVGRPVGIYVGRFCAEKRLDVLLEGHAHLPPDRRPQLVLVGDGPHRSRLERLAASRADVMLIPYIADRDLLARTLAAADFYLAPGPGETFGIAIAEAMACGLPVVAVDRGAARDRIAGSDVGELYRHGDPESAAQALGSMSRRLDVPLHRRVRAHAERTFGWDRTFSALAEIYRELARARAA